MAYLSMYFISSQRDVDMFFGFRVSYFHAIHIWTVRCRWGSWFHVFVVSLFFSPCTPYLNSEILTGFLVSSFHGFVHSISGHRDDDRFCGFMVYLSMHSNSGQQDVEIKKPASISLSTDGVVVVFYSSDMGETVT